MKGTDILVARETPIGTFYVPAPKPPEPPPLFLDKLHKLPLTLYRQMLGFLLWTQEAFSAEGLIYAFHHPEHGWHVEPPQQTTQGMTVNADGTDLEVKMAPDGWTLRFTAHHHCTSGAFQSGTDKTDEHSKPSGYHITLGELNKPQLAFHGRVVVRIGQQTHQIDMSLHDFGRHIDFDILPAGFEQHTHLLYPLLISASSASDFPAEWKERIARPKPLTHHTATTAHGGTTQTATEEIIWMNMGPIDGCFDINPLIELCKQRPLYHFLEHLNTKPNGNYDYRCLLSLLCSIYPADDVFTMLKDYYNVNFQFHDKKVMHMWRDLHMIAGIPYDITGPTISVKTEEQAAHIKTFNGDYNINCRQFNTYALSAPIATSINKLQEIAKLPTIEIHEPTINASATDIYINDLPRSYYYPKALKDRIAKLNAMEVAEAFLTIKREYEPDLLQLLMNTYALPSIISSLQKQGLNLDFQTERQKLIYQCLGLGDDFSIHFDKNTLYVTDPRLFTSLTAMRDKNKKAAKNLAIKQLTTTALIAAKTHPAPVAVIKGIEDCLQSIEFTTS